jgi:BlaI family penicillinase repressor
MSPRRVRADVADAELTVLKALWDGGPGTVRELQERLRGNAAGWAYTTVQTLLGRLLDKGLVRADRRDIAHQFAATVTREQFAGERVRQVAESVLDGALAPLLLGLLPKGRFSAQEIARLRELVDDLDADDLDDRAPPRGRRGTS